MQPQTNGATMASPDELVARIFTSTIAAMDLFSVYLGDRLGYYRALAEGGPATSAELAARTGTAERYAREWLEQQAVSGILACENPEAATGTVMCSSTLRRYAEEAGFREVEILPIENDFFRFYRLNA